MERDFVKNGMNEYRFLQLLTSTIILTGKSPVIDKSLLAKKLFDYCNMVEFKIFFDGLIIASNHIDLTTSFDIAYKLGLLTLSNDGKTIIDLTIQEAKIIQSKFSEEEQNKMNKLCFKVYEIKKIDKPFISSKIKKYEQAFKYKKF